jgi:hypothetical protein
VQRTTGEAFQTKTSALKPKTALHAIMKAINSFFVGCRQLLLWLKDRQQGVEQQKQAKKDF